jgi:hypothetical protein
MPIQGSDIRFIPMSTDPAKIKFFGTLTGVRTTSPLEITPRYSEPGCSDCMACI